MTLRKRIIISNVLMVLIPAVVTIALWIGYTCLGTGAGFLPVGRGGSEADSLGRSQNVVSVLEAELSSMKWDAKRIPGVDGTVVVFEPDEEVIAELGNLGFHLQVDATQGVFYSNFDDSDRQALMAIGGNPEGAVLETGGSVVVQHNFVIEGQPCRLTAVYDASRADAGAIESLVPFYLVAPQVLLAFLAAAVLSVIVTALLVSRWINQSVLEPLDELKSAADRIARDDLDGRIGYAKRDEFGAVCNAFDGMRVRLKEAEQEKARYEGKRRELFQEISHDLRSPLTSIKGYAMGLIDGIADTDAKKLRYYNAILSSAEDLEQLTDRLSLLTKLEIGEAVLQMEPLRIDAFVANAIEEKRVWLEDNHVDVLLQSESDAAEAPLDAGEMRRVFDNLFENTVRYRTNSASKVSISVVADGGKAEIRYLDDGPGVSDDQLERIFESFYRVDESRTQPGQGSGLGLAIVKRIVEGHGGTVRAYNDGGLGIAIDLPLA